MLLFFTPMILSVTELVFHLAKKIIRSLYIYCFKNKLLVRQVLFSIVLILSEILTGGKFGFYLINNKHININLI